MEIELYDDTRVTIPAWGCIQRRALDHPPPSVVVELLPVLLNLVVVAAPYPAW